MYALVMIRGLEIYERLKPSRFLSSTRDNIITHSAGFCDAWKQWFLLATVPCLSAVFTKQLVIVKEK